MQMDEIDELLFAAN